jgi:hypothetical protein
MRSALADELRARLGAREILEPAPLYQRFWPDLPVQDLSALFQLVEEEFSIPPGLLRPDDDLDRLLEPLSIRSPLKWLAVEPALEDATSELNYRLGQRLEARGTELGAPISSIDELVREWCGVPRVPPDPARRLTSLAGDTGLA